VDAPKKSCMKISVVIPVFNEEKIIGSLYERVMSAMKNWTEDFEIICVNDGSKDRSLALLVEAHQKDSRWKVISLSRNFGHQAAFLAGLTHTTGDLIAMLDGDLQDPPELLEQFKNKIEEGYDIVFGVRRKRKEGFGKRFAYKAYYRFLKRVSQVEIPLDSGDFSMIRRPVLEKILQSQEHSLFIRGIRSWVGFRQYGFEYERDRRFGGEPKYTIKKLIQLAYNGIFSFSTFPVKFLTTLGVVVISLALVYSAYAISMRLLYPEKVIQGFTTLAIAIFIFSGVQLIALGMIGEYVLRIYDETRNRPLFIVQDKFL
jgi:glycosyltransferase involved in cell wall biosynthesis